MPFPRHEIATQISDRLHLLAAQLKTRSRASFTDANHTLEFVMARFFNALFGWDLVNLNSEQANFPAVDLADRPRRIAMQITIADESRKIAETTDMATDHDLGVEFDRLIIFFLLDRKPGLPKKFAHPANGPTIETWDVADLLNQMLGLEIDALKAALRVLDEEMVTLPDRSYAQPGDGWYRVALLRAPRFFGRKDEIAELLTLWDQHRMLAITGTGGLGKTALAAELLAWFGPESWAKGGNQQPFPRRLLTHDYYSQPGHDSALAALLVQAGHDPKGLNRAEMESRLSAVFAQPDTFLYLEGCEKAETLRDLLRLTGTARVLLTTRDAVAPYGAHGWPLPPLRIPAAAALITDLSRRGDPFAPPAAVTEIAKLLAGHGLACRLAGQLLSHRSRSASSLLADLQKKGLGLLSQERREHESVTWLLSQTALGLEKKLPGCARVWHVLALGALSPLPLSLLRACLGGETVDEDWLRKRLESLQHEGIVQLSADFPPESGDEGECAAVLAHALIQTYGLGDLLRDLPPDHPARSEAETIYIAWREGWDGYLNRCFDSGQIPGGIRRYQALTTPLEGLITRLEEREMADSGHFSRLLGFAGSVHRWAGHFLAAKPLFRYALVATELNLGHEHPNTLTSLNNLALLLFDQGDLDGAEPLYRRALEPQERTLGPEHPDTLGTLGNLALLLKERGDTVGAEQIYRRTIEAQERTLGLEHPDTLATYNNLASLLYARGDLAGAEPLYRQAFEGRRRIFGPEHRDTLGSLNNLANLVSDLGDLAAAEHLYHHLLAGWERTLGPEHPFTLRSLHNLASLLADQGNLARAEPLYRRALETGERNQGPDHPDLLPSLCGLAILLAKQGELKRALPLFRRAVAGARRVLLPEHPDRQLYERNLAEAERMLGGGAAEGE